MAARTNLKNCSLFLEGTTAWNWGGEKKLNFPQGSNELQIVVRSISQIWLDSASEPQLDLFAFVGHVVSNRCYLIQQSRDKHLSWVQRMKPRGTKCSTLICVDRVCLLTSCTFRSLHDFCLNLRKGGETPHRNIFTATEPFSGGITDNPRFITMRLQVWTPQLTTIHLQVRPLKTVVYDSFSPLVQPVKFLKPFSFAGDGLRIGRAQLSVDSNPFLISSEGDMLGRFL